MFVRLFCDLTSPAAYTGCPVAKAETNSLHRQHYVDQTAFTNLICSHRRLKVCCLERPPCNFSCCLNQTANDVVPGAHSRGYTRRDQSTIGQSSLSDPCFACGSLASCSTPPTYLTPSPHLNSYQLGFLLTGAVANMSLKRKAAELAGDAKKVKPNASITSFFGAPKPKPGAPSTGTSDSHEEPTGRWLINIGATSTAAANFDREAWITKLTDEQKDLLKLEIDTLHESWLPHLKDVLLSAQFLELKRFLKKELASGKTVYPPMKEVYSW